MRRQQGAKQAERREADSPADSPYCPRTTQEDAADDPPRPSYRRPLLVDQHRRRSRRQAQNASWRRPLKACYLGVIKNRRGRLKMWLGESLRLLKTIPEHVGFTSHPARETGRPTAARLGPRARRALCTCSLQKTAFVKKILNRGAQELREVLRGLYGTTP